VSVSRLRLLGGFGLQSSSAPVELSLGTQRLLAFLALRGRSHRYVVAGTLWPEVPEGQALASLRTGVWRTNRTLPGLVQADGPELELSHKTTIDSREQEAFTTGLLREHREDEEWLDAGIDCLWCSELLPGWYDDWVVFERERLNQLRLHALERSARVMIRRHRLDVALHLALEAVRAEPLRESATAALMEVYLSEGNVVDALHRYEDYRALLVRELHVEPSPGLTELLPLPSRVDTRVTAHGI
jgi:DNA-binding SARP family transcriptional activator